MKCVNCGKKNKIVFVNDGLPLNMEFPTFTCDYCGYENLVTHFDFYKHSMTLKEYEYQTRLDKVLSKFEKDLLNHDIFVKKLMVAAEIQYGDCIKNKSKGFYLFATYNGYGGASDYIEISLKTVESLLKDLEMKK